ncbi:MAG: choice-of-anchor D domain-containing protein [Myxococcales bacterium]|jgi:hypothetical protein
MRNRLPVLIVALSLVGCDCGGEITKGATGELFVEEKQISFGATCPKPSDPSLALEPVVKNLRLSNQGNATLYINQLEVEPSRSELFVVDRAKVPETIAAGETAEVPIAFQPLEAGIVAADLTVVADDEAPVVVKLMGEGLNLPPDPVLSMSCPGGKWSNDSCAGPNANYFFVDTPVHSMSEASIELKNGGCAPMRVTALKATTQVYGSEDPATFALADGHATELVVKGGGSEQVRVRFAPKAESSFIGSLEFTTNAPDQKTVALPLRGEGIRPVLELDPILCDFRALPPSCDGLFSVSNSGGQELVIQAVKIYGGNPMFSIAKAPASGARIGPTSTLADAIQIEYVPGPVKGSDLLVVESSGGTATAELRGGSPPVLLTEPEDVLDFGDHLSSTTDYYLPVKIKNVATYHRQLPLTIRSIRIDTTPPSNASDTFELASDGSASCPAAPAPNTQVAPGGEVLACLHFKSTPNGGTFFANLLIDTDDPDYPAPGYLLSVSASTTCNPAPIAEISAPTGAACPCASGEECIGAECHKLASVSAVLANATIVLSGERSWDQVPDNTGACTVQDPSAIARWDWTLVNAPDGSTATLSPSGQGTASRTTLSFDKIGQYLVGLSVYDDSGLVSPPTTMLVTVEP